MHDPLVSLVISEIFNKEIHISHDATYFESCDACKSSKKKKVTKQKRGFKSKEGRAN